MAGMNKISVSFHGFFENSMCICMRAFLFRAKLHISDNSSVCERHEFQVILIPG